MEKTEKKEEGETKQLCEVCSAPCSQNCANCKKVNYCTKEHQKSHWRQHKSNCFPVIVKKDSIRGRFLVATRNISLGEILLKEKPIISGPSANGDPEYHPVCLSCYKIVKNEFRCSKCNWPVCDKQCETNEIHSSMECYVLKENKIPPFSQDEHHLYHNITLLRLLQLKDANPKKWKHVQQLEAHLSERKIQSQLTANHPYVLAVEFIEQCGLSEKFPTEIIEFVSGLLNINSMSSNDLPTIESSLLYRCGSYLYFTGSMACHSCLPNTNRSIQLNSELQVRATVSIKAGEEVTIGYGVLKRVTQERINYLHTYYHFTCTCSRCKDPTEFGTYFSAVKCTSTQCKNLNDDKIGYLLPINPLNESSVWKCNNEKCRKTENYSYVAKIIQDIEAEKELVPFEASSAIIEMMEKIVHKHEGITVHRNHSLMYAIEYDMVLRIDCLLTNSVGSVDADVARLISRQMQLTRKCLSIVDALMPGYTRVRGLILYFLQKASALLLLLGVYHNNLRNEHSSKPGLRKEFENIIATRKEVHAILSFDPKGSDENRIASYMPEDCESLAVARKYFNM